MTFSKVTQLFWKAVPISNVTATLRVRFSEAILKNKSYAASVLLVSQLWHQS